MYGRLEKRSPRRRILLGKKDPRRYLGLSCRKNGINKLPERGFLKSGRRHPKRRWEASLSAELKRRKELPGMALRNACYIGDLDSACLRQEILRSRENGMKGKFKKECKGVRKRPVEKKPAV